MKAIFSAAFALVLLLLIYAIAHGEPPQAPPCEDYELVCHKGKKTAQAPASPPQGPPCRSQLTRGSQNEPAVRYSWEQPQFYAAPQGYYGGDCQGGSCSSGQGGGRRFGRFR